MALQMIVESLDKVPEAVREMYVEKDGKFALQVDGIEDNSGLKTALEKERSNAAEARRAAKAYEGLGLTPEEIKTIVADKKAAETKRLQEEGNFNAILKQKEDEWKAELEKERGEALLARQSEHKAVIGTSLMAALTKMGATEEGIELLPDRLATRIKYETENGQRRIRILSTDGETPLAGSAKDGTATFDDLAKEAMTKFPSLFKGTGNAGGGKPPNSAGGAGGKTMTRTAFNALSIADQRATVMGGTTLVD